MVFCKHCSTPFEERGPKIFCSARCGNKFALKRWKEQNPHSNKGLPTSTVGAVHELVVCADLLRRGLHVFRSVSPSAVCDLAILDGNKLFRIEVTTGTRSIGGKLQYPTKDPFKFDILAVVEHSGNITYYPDLESLLTKN